jgi:hypothetical protein
MTADDEVRFLMFANQHGPTALVLSPNPLRDVDVIRRYLRDKADRLAAGGIDLHVQRYLRTLADGFIDFSHDVGHAFGDVWADIVMMKRNSVPLAIATDQYVCVVHDVGGDFYSWRPVCILKSKHVNKLMPMTSRAGVVEVVANIDDES